MAISKALMEGRSARISGKREVQVLQTKLVNLSNDLSIGQFIADMKFNVDRPRANSRITLWGGNRQLKRQDIGLQEQRQLIEGLDNLGLTAIQLAETQARIVMIPDMVEGIISGRKSQVELATKQFWADMQAIDNEVVLGQVAISDAKADVSRKNTETYIIGLIGEAKARAIRAGAMVEEARAKMLEKLNREMDLNNISSSQAYVLAKALNPNDGSAVDFGMKERMFEEDLFKAKQQNRMHKSDADLREHSVNDEIREDENTRGGFGQD